MKLVLNGINGEYLRNITGRAVADTELVEAAVAYASEVDLLFTWCWENKIPLRYWGRFDEGVPVAVPVLRTFLARRSPNYACSLLRCFHAKVIWWHGVGAYVGSANLSNAAWYNNIEAGTFFEEAELEGSGMDTQLRDFFRRVHAQSTPLSEELVEAIEARSKELSRIDRDDRQRQREFLETTGVKKWNGLVQQSKSDAASRLKEEFLQEWYATLQILRDIGAHLADGAARPEWLPEGVPFGAHADQFLHAYYYNHVIAADRSSQYEELHQTNRRNPQAALDKALGWWSEQKKPPTHEDVTLLEWAPFLREALSQDRLLTLTADDFEEVCSRVWSMQDHARRVPNATLSLPPPPDGKYEMPEKTSALAKYLYSRKASNGANVRETLHYVLYGGDDAGLPNRLWEATAFDGQWKIEHLGISALGELVGWALPDRFPPRNNRTSKALYSLGYPVAFA